MIRILVLALLLAGLAAEDVIELRRFPDRAVLTAERWGELQKALVAASRKPTTAEDQAIGALVKGEAKPLAFITRNRQAVLAIYAFTAADHALNGDDYRLVPAEACTALLTRFLAKDPAK